MKVLTFLAICVAVVHAEFDDVPSRRFSDYQETPRVDAPRISRVEEPSLPFSQPHYEPVFSFGPFFLARVTSTPIRSPIVPYTRNKTILYCSLFSWTLGFLLGAALALKLSARMTKTQSVDKSTSTEMPEDETEDEISDQGRQTCEETPFKIHRLSNRALDEIEELENENGLPEMGDGLDESSGMKSEKAVRSASSKKALKTADIGNCTAISSPVRDYERGVMDSVSLHKSINHLTQKLESMEQPLATVAGAAKEIDANVGSITGFMRHLVRRKCRKDAWLNQMDNVSFGIIITNLSMFVSAFFFGRWQDWGRQCGRRFMWWTIHSLLATIWCYIEEPCIFCMGCVLWWITAKLASSSATLRKKDPLSSVLLGVTLVFAGLVHSSIVSLLGGSWTITFSIWIIYSMFLYRSLEAAKIRVLKESEGQGSVLSPDLFDYLTWNETISDVMSALVFPFLVGTLPFWNAGLYVMLTSGIDQSWFNIMNTVGSVKRGISNYLME